MPVSRTCTFCGNDIEPGTGKMYVRRDGNVHFFCSGKCQKNQLGLGRVGRKVRWTRRYVRAAQQQAPRPVAAPAAEVAVETPVEGDEPPSDDREGVLKAFSELPGIGDATAQALWEAGFTSKAKLQGATEEELTKIKGLGPASAKKILSHLQESSG